MTMSRRQWFGLFRQRARSKTDAPIPAPQLAQDPASSPAEPSFALDDFYADRSPSRTIPHFAIQAAYAAPTTRVGTVSFGSHEIRTATGDFVADSSISDLRAIPGGLVPHVLADACLATTSFCSVCVERCPVPGAIEIVNQRPRVVAAQCDGCGVCVRVCPSPILAFELVARSEAT